MPLFLLGLNILFVLSKIYGLRKFLSGSMKKYFYTILPVFLFFCNGTYCQLKYSNPILAGFYPDPSICRVGGDYYLVNSSFAYFPGIPIFHSTDLVNWNQIGNAMDRNMQLDLSNADVSGGLYAPTIRYHKGLFYIICTNVSHGGNFIITAKNPAGEWSDPVFLPDVNGIDPSLFFDDDKAYITYNSEPPDNKSLYNGHRTIRIIQYDVEQKKTIGGNKIIVNGGTDITKHPVWIEGPHLYKIKGWYYLMCAEGGTADQHSEVIFRSKKVDGGFVPYENNPILTQRDLNPERENPITSTGHADLVETPEGAWYAVFLGCRPYAGEFYNTGRETFMAPVVWQNGWPTIMEKHTEVQYQYPVPFASTKKIANNFSGNYLVKEDFNSNKLHPRFVFLRNPTEDLYHIQKGFLELPLKATAVAEKANPAFIGFRQAHLTCTASTRVLFNATKENEKAGLIVFQNEHHYYFLCKSIRNNKPVVELYKSAPSGNDELLAIAELKSNSAIELKIEANKDVYSFYFSVEKNNWTLLKDHVDAKYLSTQIAGGFTGCVFAMYAMSNGVSSDNNALYDWFAYKGNDAVFRGQNKKIIK